MRVVELRRHSILLYYTEGKKLFCKICVYPLLTFAVD